MLVRRILGLMKRMNGSCLPEISIAITYGREDFPFSFDPLVNGDMAAGRDMQLVIELGADYRLARLDDKLYTLVIALAIPLYELELARPGG
jgi:hypothetical protein